MKPLSKPVLVFDGDCSFCRRWINRWKTFTRDTVDYAPYQNVSQQYPEISLKRFQTSVQLVMPEGKVFEGAEAVFRTLAVGGKQSRLLWMYQHIPFFAPLSELFYRLVASHRVLFSRCERFFFLHEKMPFSGFRISSWIFLRLLGVSYAIAFLSLASQIIGLIGEGGMIPAEEFLRASANRYDFERFWLAPTLLWISASDTALRLLCYGGAVLAFLLTCGVASRVCLSLLWLFYLSLTVVGGAFLSFQWDVLLLEAGFLSLFIAPRGWGPTGVLAHEPSRLGRWMLKWLLFRLMFMSGAVKLLSGDEAWRNLTALKYHYETQPIPTPLAWTFHQWPEILQRASGGATFFIELILPFFIFFPKHMRHAACAGLAGFQVLIILTGNYCFFNLLTLALCVFLIQDAVWIRMLPWKSLKTSSNNPAARGSIGVLCFFLIYIFLSFTVMTARFTRDLVPPVMNTVLRWVQPLRTVNAYGLFAVMTTKRPEIVLEGSNDGINWLPYEFKYKIQDVSKPPPWVAPHQPRLDWQMWFAALDSSRRPFWFLRFCERILQGSPEVLALLAHNPFPGAPPKTVRAVLYLYQFTNAQEREKTGAWWKREKLGLYMQPIEIDHT